MHNLEISRGMGNGISSWKMTSGALLYVFFCNTGPVPCLRPYIKLLRVRCKMQRRYTALPNACWHVRLAFIHPPSSVYPHPPPPYRHFRASINTPTRFPPGVNTFPALASSSILRSIAASKLLSISLLGVQYAFGSNALAAGVLGAGPRRRVSALFCIFGVAGARRRGVMLTLGGTRREGLDGDGFGGLDFGFVGLSGEPLGVVLSIFFPLLGVGSGLLGVPIAAFFLSSLFHLAIRSAIACALANLGIGVPSGLKVGPGGLGAGVGRAVLMRD